MAVPAFATDLKGSDPTSADYVAPISWSGFYVGARAGIGNANHDVGLDIYETQDTDKDGVTSVDILTLDGLNSSGFVGGVNGGYDQQIGRFVVGVFGSYDWTNMETELGIFPGVGGPTYTMEKEDEWSVGLRGGFLVNQRTLVYLLAAYTETEYSLNGPGVDKAGPALNKEVTFTGVTAGGGIEFAITQNIYAGLEYTHFFGDEENWLDTCNGVAKCPGGLRVSDDLSEDKIMATLKFKLNSGFGF
jgi:outer membrane immunogenic protein